MSRDRWERLSHVRSLASFEGRRWDVDLLRSWRTWGVGLVVESSPTKGWTVLVSLGPLSVIGEQS